MQEKIPTEFLLTFHARHQVIQALKLLILMLLSVFCSCRVSDSGNFYGFYKIRSQWRETQTKMFPRQNPGLVHSASSSHGPPGTQEAALSLPCTPEKPI